MKVLIIGGSRNIGYYSAQRLLASGATVTFLLRNPSCFDSDTTIKPYIDSGKVRISKGDALVEADVQKAWEVAAEGEEPLNAVLFTVGGKPKLHITKGAVLDVPNLCAASMLNLLSVYRAHLTSPTPTPAILPKLILISSTGLSKMSHDALPLLMKPLYGYLLRLPHVDKLGMERAVAYAAGWKWEDEEPRPDILGEGWKKRLGEGGWLKDVCVVRPAMLTDGDCKADALAGAEGKQDKKGKKKEPYRAEEKEVASGYTVSRKDIAHFVVERALKDWDAWNGKCVRIAY